MNKSLVSFIKSKTGTVILLILIFFLFAGIVISRRVDSVVYPQFWAEDGVFWYSEAYNTTNPVTLFLIPKQGYFQTISRVGGAVGVLFDIRQAPLIFNLVAIAIQVLPALFFLSRRFEKIAPKLYQRFFLGLAYLILPGTAETHANLTNAQWHLAILMFLLIVAAPAKNNYWRIFDVIFLLLAGLSGPFIFFAFPISLAYFYFTKNFREKILSFNVLALTFLLQIYSFFFIVSDAARSKEQLGANLINFFKILAGDVFVTGIYGLNHYQHLTHSHAWKDGTLPVIFGTAGIILLGYIFWKSTIELRLFIIYAFMILAAGMASPMVSLDKPQWQLMAGGSGNRYYLLPILAWIVSLIWLAFYGSGKIYRGLAIVLLLIFIFVGVPRDYIFKPKKNFHFQEQAQAFNKLPAGQPYTFKFIPKWTMTLIKK